MLYLFLVVPRVPSYTLFPYTTLFRSTILGWAYYGEKCFQYLFQSITAIRAYRIIFVLFIFIGATATLDAVWARSEEHTSELQSRGHLVCRLLLEKKQRMILYDACT